MAQLHKNVTKGRPYYCIREIQRVGGKPKVVSQTCLGSIGAIAKRFREADRARKPLQLRSRAFGAVFVAGQARRGALRAGLREVLHIGS